jgi:hypothetical protein
MHDVADKPDNVVACASTVTDGAYSTTRVSKPMPLPCITILIHGVNDVGEAFSPQEEGICKGLNARLNRSHELNGNAIADLIPSQYSLPPQCGAGKNTPVKDPDKTFFHRTPDSKTWSPIIPFYWGSREEEALINKNNWHGQWTDRYGNRIDKNGAKNGGPFGNATNNLNAMWGVGFNGSIAGVEFAAQEFASPTHDISKKAPPRHYMLLAAKRLAMLIKMIRNNDDYKQCAINVVCHSQGSMVTLVAHALLEADGGYSADTVIFQDPPYGIEETLLEKHDGSTGDKQQTTQSRVKTLGNIVKYVHAKKAATPALAELDFRHKIGKGVAGPFWAPGPGAKQWVAPQEYTFVERDNRGKVYLYFCQHDSTVALRSVQGIGWQGVPDKIDAPAMRIKEQREGLHEWDGTELPTTDTVSALAALGDGFRQRIFTSRIVKGQPVLVGAQPGPYEMRTKGHFWNALPFVGEGSMTGSSKSKGIDRGAMRSITGEELKPPVRAALTAGEAGHAGKLDNSPIDAAIAIAQDGIDTDTSPMLDFRSAASGRRGVLPLTADEQQQFENQLPGQKTNVAPSDADNRLHIISVDRAEKGGIWITHSTETANEARVRWQNKTDDNSYHSAIPANPAHAAGVTAYDLSLGMPLPITQKKKGHMDYWRAVADWRTDWKAMEKSKDSEDKKMLEFKTNEKTAGATALIDATIIYHSTGVLPPDIAVNDVVKLPIPTLIVSQTLRDRSHGIDVHHQSQPA